ncbi:MAG: N-acetylmuramoyl-L-alanine amidase [Pseudomonadota bacterium]
MAIDWPSPNHGPRREGPIDMVVLHYTAMASAEAALRRLSDPSAEVSAHYLIARDGRLFAMVPEARRAWHAGVSRWGAVEDVNSRSIGIELDNPAGDPTPPFAEPLMARLEGLLAEILARHAIPPERVVGHACIAPGRKQDPGPRFDWRRLARQGLAVWLDPAPKVAPGSGEHDPGDPVVFAQALQQLGMAVPAPERAAWSEAHRAAWQAFAPRFLPHRASLALPDAAAVAHAVRVAAAFPVQDPASSLP